MALIDFSARKLHSSMLLPTGIWGEHDEREGRWKDIVMFQGLIDKA